jgi:hypothetical protein
MPRENMCCERIVYQKVSHVQKNTEVLPYIIDMSRTQLIFCLENKIFSKFSLMILTRQISS